MFLKRIENVTSYILKGSQNISPQMRYVQLPILANSECSRVYGNVVLATSLCVSGANGKSSCEGDSGKASDWIEIIL